MREVLEFFDNLTSGKIIGLIIALILLIFIFPMIDNNYLYFQRVNKRIEVLDNISKLDLDKIKDNQLLEKEYQNILNEIKDFDEEYLLSTNSLFYERNSKEIKTIKSLTGAFLFIILFFRAILSKNSIGKKFFQSGVFLIMGIIGAYIAYKVPTFRHCYINYLGFPIIEIILLYSAGKVVLKEKEND